MMQFLSAQVLHTDRDVVSASDHANCWFARLYTAQPCCKDDKWAAMYLLACLHRDAIKLTAVATYSKAIGVPRAVLPMEKLNLSLFLSFPLSVSLSLLCHTEGGG